MAHRSNQAVASQERPAPQTPEDDPQTPRRLLIGWTTALLALGASTAALGVALWFLRFPIATFFLGAALADRGAEADFQIVNLDFGHAVLADVRFGSETSPDAAIDRVEARWSWSGLTPRLEAVTIASPRVHLRIDQAGRVSAGSLDRLGGGQGRTRPSLPEMDLTIEGGQATIDAPFGALVATFEGAGTLGQNFSAMARLPETSRPGETHALSRGAAELIVVSREDNIALRLTANAAALRWAGADVSGARLRVMARAPLDLSRYDVEAAWGVTSLSAPGVSANVITGSAGAEGVAREDSIEPQVWQGEARLNASVLTFGDNTIQHMRSEGRVDGRDAGGQGTWSVTGQRFDGFSLVSERPSASGRFALDLQGDETFSGVAQLVLSQSRLDANAQQRLRETFPDMPDAPVGPTFARAETALDAAADRFDLTLPLTIHAAENGTRIVIATPAEARAANGALLRLSPLRDDAPALTLQWPGPALHGAVALQLSGGGAPSISLLLDTLNWAPDEPLEGDGTLTLADWRTDNASIAANELNVGIAVQPNGSGHVDVRGPATITGPLGDGEVRNLVAQLDLAIRWKPGWSVTSNRGCLPMQLGGLDAAGLSFSNGAFALCPQGGALIAADANTNLSGGFAIQRLALSGRMAGEAAQPAHLRAADVVGRFSGRSGNITLALQATTPSLSIEMAEDRTMAVTLARLTANARITDTWQVDGEFTQGTLSDPTLPGSVSTIAGRWSAAPQDGQPVIRVEAGEALLTANRPASDEERPLFNPLRMVNAGAVLVDGRIDASGQIVLVEPSRQLAVFNAHHVVSEGAGGARIQAASIVFDQSLQPYQISEQARGLVENVTGEASVVADILWTSDQITSSGTVSLNGLSLATSTIPAVTGVRGAIFFDDLFAMTTPPGQRVTVGSLNPGVTVRNGAVQFQLLPEERVAIEQAVFEFAGGQLAMQPTTIRLGADSTQFELTLRDVDATDLISSLSIPDLQATGRVEGSFPLTLTRTSALIENGVLRALPGGGVISYTGNAGDAATGVSRIAFDALRSFRYDDLVLTLNGDLSGDVVSSIEFIGQNSGRAVDLSEMVQLPGVGRVTVRGVPFDFNVRVTAPFRRLAQTAASLTDPGSLINQANPGADAEEQPAPVDQEAPAPR